MKNLLLVKVRQILDAVICSPEPISLHELSEKFSIPSPTVSRIASDLVEMGLIEKIGYHHYASGPGMVAFGDLGRRNCRLFRAAEPLVRNFAANFNMNALLGGIYDDKLFQVFSCGQVETNHRLLWRTGLATALLAADGVSKADAILLYNEEYPEADAAERLIFEQELDNAKNQKQLVRISSMRQWSVSMPFICNGVTCALCVFGAAPANRTPEGFCFDLSVLVSKIRSVSSMD